MITIEHIIFYGNESVVVDMSGISTNLVFEKNGGDLSLLNISEAVTMRGTVGGGLSLSGAGTITLSGVVTSESLDRDAFTGTIDLNGFWFDHPGTIIWVFATETNLIETWRITGGIA